jgi:hypothetical protein
VFDGLAGFCGVTVRVRGLLSPEAFLAITEIFPAVPVCEL